LHGSIPIVNASAIECGAIVGDQTPGSYAQRCTLPVTNTPTKGSSVILDDGTVCDNAVGPHVIIDAATCARTVIIDFSALDGKGPGVLDAAAVTVGIIIRNIVVDHRQCARVVHSTSIPCRHPSSDHHVINLASRPAADGEDAEVRGPRRCAAGDDDLVLRVGVGTLDGDVLGQRRQGSGEGDGSHLRGIERDGTRTCGSVRLVNAIEDIAAVTCPLIRVARVVDDEGRGCQATFQ
jgi:hypothetical protein